MTTKKLKVEVLLVLVLLVGATLVAGQQSEMEELIIALKKIAAGLATLLIAYQGLKYVTAQSPEDRAEAKKGMIYVILGLLVAAIAAVLVCGLYCEAIKTTYGEFNCDASSGICKIT